MSTELENNFRSIRRALKVCSILLVVFAMLHTPRVITSLGRSEMIWGEMMGDAKGPWVFGFSRFLANYFLFFAIGLLGVLIGCIVFTRKSSGGGFLYLNLGIYLALSVLNSFLVDLAQQMMRAPIEALMTQ